MQLAQVGSINCDAHPPDIINGQSLIIKLYYIPNLVFYVTLSELKCHFPDIYGLYSVHYAGCCSVKHKMTFLYKFFCVLWWLLINFTVSCRVPEYRLMLNAWSLFNQQSSRVFFILCKLMDLHNWAAILWGLRLPHRNDAEIAKICNLWTFWLVIQLISRLLAELQAKMSKGCGFLLFWHHSYEVTLNGPKTFLTLIYNSTRASGQSYISYSMIFPILRLERHFYRPHTSGLVKQGDIGAR